MVKVNFVKLSKKWIGRLSLHLFKLEFNLITFQITNSILVFIEGFCILCSENFAQHERDNLCCKTGLRRGEMLLLFADLIARFSLLLCFIVYEAAARMSVNLTSTSQHKPARAGSISYSTIFLGKTTTTKRKEEEKEGKPICCFSTVVRIANWFFWVRKPCLTTQRYVLNWVTTAPCRKSADPLPGHFYGDDFRLLFSFNFFLAFTAF